ncbi:MAG TPA: retropepsin-like aspartic protease [Vicinamibacterales bacterium]|nr:retropepsin-like aspartic protease [Vicinamibacterales bacterium]
MRLLVVLVLVATISSPALVDLPMRFRGPEPAVEVMVNGQGPFLFAIDTGATDDARVDASLVERLGLRVSGTDHVGDGSAAKKLRVGTVRLDSLTVGTLTFHHVKASTRDFNTLGLPRIDGLLTFDLFRDLLLTLDYPGQRVRLEQGELPAADGKGILQLRRVHGHPAVDLTIGSERVRAELDSGNVGDGFLFPGPVVARLSLATEPVDAGTGRTVTSVFSLKSAQLRENIRFGAFEFTQPRIVFPAPFPFADIGSRILNQFAVTFDQKHDRVRFVR